MNAILKPWVSVVVIGCLSAFTLAIFTESYLLDTSANNLVNAVTMQTKVSLSLTPKNVQCTPLALTGEAVALPGVVAPVCPEAQRLTFDSEKVVRYRSNLDSASLQEFFANNLEQYCWKEKGGEKNILTYENNSGRLMVNLDENPISKKTVVTYAYIPLSSNVLGVKLAQADMPSFDPNQIPQGMPSGMNMPQMPEGFDPNQIPKGMPGGMNMPQMPGGFNQMNSQGDGQAGFGMPQQMGPSDEDMQKMDEMRFAQMKKGLGQFSKGAQTMKKSLAKLKTKVGKCGVGIPEELQNAIDASDGLATKIESAQTADELEEIISDVEDVSSVMQEWGPKMGDLQKLCSMLTAADKEVLRIKKALAKYESKAKTNTKIDLTDLLAQYKQDAQTLTDTLVKIKELAKTDPESAGDMIETDFFDLLDNIHNSEMAIDVALNVSKGLKNMDLDLKSLERQITALKKKKVDVAEHLSILTELKAKNESLKQKIKSKFDAEEVIAEVEEFFQEREALQDKIQESGGATGYEPKVKVDASYNVNVNMPDAFLKQTTTESTPGAVIEE